jgi:hypothetical protein
MTVVAWLCALVLQQPAAASPQGASDASLPPEEFAGCWQDLAEETRYVEIERGRMRELRGGEVELTRATYDVDTLTRHVWGRREVWTLSFEDEDLVIEHGEFRRRLRRAKERPAALDPEPLDLPEPAELAADALAAARIATIQSELRERRDLDQAVRTDPARADEGEAVDADNTRRLIELVQEVGAIDVARFGHDAAGSAFLIVQHSGRLPLMLAALPRIERDVKDHDLDPQNFALLFDRLQVRMGRKQRYGSQIGADESGRMIVLALEDRERVEEIRAAIGLFPLARYLGMFPRAPGSPEIGFEDDRAD